MLPTQFSFPVTIGSSPLLVRSTAVSALTNRQVSTVPAPAVIVNGVALNSRMPGAGTWVGAFITVAVADVVIGVGGAVVAVAVGSTAVAVGVLTLGNGGGVAGGDDVG